MSDHGARLTNFRKELIKQNLNGFVVPLTDEHMSEYVGTYAQRLAWLTGFEGSAGSAVILVEKAAIFTDGRYTLQVREQVDGTLFDYRDVPQDSTQSWLGENITEGDVIGYDAWLHGKPWAEQTAAIVAAKGGTLVAVEANPVDAVWADQPAPSDAPFFPHEDAQAGRTSHEKRAEIAEWMRAEGADALIVAALDSVAWLFNIRGNDVAHTPVGLAFAVLSADGTAAFFAAPEKITEDVRAHLGADVQVRDRADFVGALQQLGEAGKTVIADPGTSVAAIFQALEAGGARVIEARDPCILAKAVKNQAEVEGMRAAHFRDGGALTKFLAWFDNEAPKGGMTELSAAAKLEDIRRESNLLRDLSFDTISGAGPNAAIPHYRVDEKSSRAIEKDMIYLVDSGGQYPDGTTDVTRTMIVGSPTDEMKDRFTRVLKGHIALATARFPAGTTGGQLDALARQFLWSAGLDYAHGTGHGVGSYLSVHEGPQRIATRGSDEPLVPGMILSNEPGYYKSGEYGIRIENLVLVKPVEVDGAERDMFEFETLTLAPIDQRLIARDLLTDAERDWLNAYHARVREEIGSTVPAEHQDWFAAATQPI